MARTIVKVKNITKIYEKRVILDEISFQINEGEIVALLGENGAGKSTLINIILQLIPKHAGEVELFGAKTNLKHQRSLIGVMLQKNLSLNRITVSELIQLARSYYQEPLDYSELINLAGLTEFEKQDISKLSGGQKRHLSFAVALAGNPKLIFLDEPTSGMDSNSRKKFWNKVSELKQQGRTFLVTSHYLEELENTADRIMILKQPKLIYDGSLQDLRARLGNYIVSFVTDMPVNNIKQLRYVKNWQKINCRYELLTDQVNELLIELQPYLAEINELNIEQNSLETLFYEISQGADNK